MEIKIGDLVRIKDVSFPRGFLDTCAYKVGDLLVCKREWKEQQAWARKTNEENMRRAKQLNQHWGRVGAFGDSWNLYEVLFNHRELILHDDYIELIQRIK